MPRIRAARRVPAVRFETPPPQLDEILPRMDIAAFAGFAATGPVHVPIPVESVAEFDAIFGGEPPLAWDPARGEIASARLAPAVRAFFGNGGTRCWVVRVASDPSTNYFPIPGLVRLSADGLAPAFARGRADGSWCDGVRVGSAMAPAPLDVIRVTRHGERLEVDATVGASGEPEAGDLLRLSFEDGHVAFVAVEGTRLVHDSPPSERKSVRVTGRAVWFRAAPPSLDSPALSAVAYAAFREPARTGERMATEQVRILNPPAEWTSTPDGLVRLDLQIDLARAPEPGALLSVTAGAGQLWLSVRSVGALGERAGGTGRARVTGRGMWFLHTAPAGERRVVRADRVALELWARRDEDQLFGLRDLGLVPGHPRYWATARHDDEWYGVSAPESTESRGLSNERRFPLAGAGPADAIYIPIDIALTPDRFLGAVPQQATALERDGLAVFSPALFLDPDLIAPLTEPLQGEAERLRYTAGSPRRLKGIHALMEIDEATIVAVPDASHRGWTRAAFDTPPPPGPSPSVPPPAFGAFLHCDTRVLAPPEWTGPFSSQDVFRIDSGTYTLEWQGREAETFVVEEAHDAEWADAVAIQSGAATRLNVYGRARGLSYYRVRAVTGMQTSNWSRGLAVLVGGADAWQTIDERDYSAETLLVVQRALLRMAAARGDLFALLSLPEHYRADAVTAHMSLLTRSDGPSIPVIVDRRATRPGPQSLALGVAEARAFSYGAIYHPWVMLREQTSEAISRMPPDGSLAGLLAHRALTRGAWIAPANDALGGVVALSPAIARETTEALLALGVNVIQQTPRGFLPQSANTLSGDPDLSLINVRRLLSLLRRLALREGVTYAFEPHDAAFERAVERGFESLLTYMFERGAFAGTTSAGAFQVNTGGSLNTGQGLNAGRFVVELRVAPSLPMSFLTVRLVQSGDRTLVTEER